MRFIGRRAAAVWMYFVSLCRFHPFSRLGPLLRPLLVGPISCPYQIPPSFQFPPSGCFGLGPFSHPLSVGPLSRPFLVEPVRAPFQVSATRRSNEKGFKINRPTASFWFRPLRAPFRVSFLFQVLFKRKKTQITRTMSRLVVGDSSQILSVCWSTRGKLSGNRSGRQTRDHFGEIFFKAKILKLS